MLLIRPWIAKSKDADILALPAGFLFHDIPESRQEIAEALIDGARKRNIAVIFGVDDENEAHGYAWSPLDNATYSWDQDHQQNIGMRSQLL